jgi:PPM family protein phosphatase
MELTFAAATDVGRQRSHNEDNFLIDKKLRLFLVADGMGGHAAGEVASSIAVHEIRDAVSKSKDLIDRYRAEHPAVQAYEILQVLEHAIQTACGAVHSRAQAEPDKRGMGTTATVLLIAGLGDKLHGFIAHVGDSRVYLARQSQSHVLTEDHSLMNELIRRGKLTRDQIEQSPYKAYKNAVTRAVGVYGSVEVDTFDFDILPGDRFLLCTDGLYGYLAEGALPATLADGDIKEVPQKLVDVANAGGGHDNITAVVIRVGGEVAEADAHSADISLKLEVLKGLPMFLFLSYKELVRVSSIAKLVDATEGQVIFAEGQAGDAMYVVVRGAVVLSKGETKVSELAKGQHFGEMSLVDRSVRSLTAIAAAGTRLLVLQRKDFYDLVRREPQAAVKMLWRFVTVLAARLRKTTTDLSDALHALHGDNRSIDTDIQNLFVDVDAEFKRSPPGAPGAPGAPMAVASSGPMRMAPAQATSASQAPVSGTISSTTAAPAGPAALASSGPVVRATPSTGVPVAGTSVHSAPTVGVKAPVARQATTISPAPAPTARLKTPASGSPATPSTSATAPAAPSAGSPSPRPSPAGAPPAPAKAGPPNPPHGAARSEPAPATESSSTSDAAAFSNEITPPGGLAELLPQRPPSK